MNFPLYLAAKYFKQRFCPLNEYCGCICVYYQTTIVFIHLVLKARVSMKNNNKPIPCGLGKRNSKKSTKLEKKQSNILKYKYFSMAFLFFLFDKIKKMSYDFR